MYQIRRSSATIVKTLVVLILLMMVFGKALLFPVGVAISPVSNDYVDRLDLMIIAPEYVIELKKGDLVLACRNGWWNTACLLGIYNGGDKETNINGPISISVLGNGDGFKGSLILNGDFRSFKVLARIPNVVWIPLFSICIFYLILMVRNAFRKKQVLAENYTLVALSMILIVMNVFIVGATYVDQVAVTHALPGITIRDRFFLDNSSLLINIVTSENYTLERADCKIMSNGVIGAVNGVSTRGDKGRNGNGLTDIGLPAVSKILDQRTILVEIPLEIYYVVFNKTKLDDLPVRPAVISREALIPMRCELVFDRFKLILSAYASFSWRDLEVYIKEHGRLLVNNSNPVPIGINLIVFDMDKELIVRRDEYIVPRLSSLEVDIADQNVSRARIIVEYELLGIHRVRVGYYERKP